MEINWGSVIVSGLKIVLSLVRWMKERELIQAGTDQEIARISMEIFKKTETARMIDAEIDKLNDDDIMRKLEPDFRD